MGCSGGKEEITNEEYCIIEGEEALMYSCKNCKEVDKIHRKYSFEGKINKLQFEEITKTLELAVGTNPTEKMLKFYDNFKIVEGTYSLFKLLVLSMLISSGNPINKARVLFEIEDSLGVGIIKRTNVIHIVNEIIKISVELLPTLYVENSSFTQNENENYIRRYLKAINLDREKAVEALTDEYMGANKEQIEVSEFVNNFRKDSTAKLLRPHFIRKFAKKASKEAIR